MTQPTPTQSRHPWRATARTIVAAAVGLVVTLPVIATAVDMSSVPWLAGVLAAAGVVTRILAVPAVDDWLRRWVPWLAAQPPNRDAL